MLLVLLSAAVRRVQVVLRLGALGAVARRGRLEVLQAARPLRVPAQSLATTMPS